MSLFETLIGLLPALALVGLLLLGYFPGEEAISRLAAKRVPRRPKAPVSLRPVPRAPRVTVRPGELLARSLATRPPPAAALV